MRQPAVAGDPLGDGGVEALVGREARAGGHAREPDEPGGREEERREIGEAIEG